jgi:hypothetical protein
MTTFYCLRFETTPNLQGQVPVFIIPQEQGGPVIFPGTVFHVFRHLRLAELRWRYSTPPPNGRMNRALTCCMNVSYRLTVGHERASTFLFQCIVSTLSVITLFLFGHVKCNTLYRMSTVGNVSILGGHSIGHFKQKDICIHVSYCERFPR